MRTGPDVLRSDGWPIGEHQPHRWRCMVHGCPVHHRWHNDPFAERSLREHYMLKHWTPS